MPSPESPENLVRLFVIGVILLGMAAAAVAHFVASSVHANGRVIEFDRRVAGPYEIAFGKIPSTPIVGNFYMSIRLTEAESKAPVLSANVVVSATGPPVEGEASPTMDGSPMPSPTRDSPEIGPIVVNPDPDSQNYPGYYDTEQPIVLDRTGLWVFTVSVDSAQAGAATDRVTAEFPVEVTTPNPITGIITLVALLMFIIVVALAIRMFVRERRRSRARIVN